MISTILPTNNVIIDYNNLLNNFIELIKEKQKDNLRSIFLTGSYARGDANDVSDLDVWCIFTHIDNKVLHDVGITTEELPDIEINPQCFSIEEFQSEYFANWSEKSVKLLDAVVLYGDNFFGGSISKSEIKSIYKRYLVDVLMSIRHYICSNEPAEKLTYKKIRTYILKPLMYPLRLERYCSLGYYPKSNNDLFKSYEGNELHEIVQYFFNEEKYNEDIKRDHRAVLSKMQSLIAYIIKH